MTRLKEIKKQKQRKSSGALSYILIGAAVFVVIMVLYTLFFTSGPVVVDEDVEDDDAFLGSMDAPVVIVEFSDYECPACRNFALNTEPQLKREYIDTGKVRFVYRDFPLSQHTFAQKAAEATECAEENGLFWDLHDKLFENQEDLSIEAIAGYGEGLGMDRQPFIDCVLSGKYGIEVGKDYADGLEVGVKSTPSFVINGVLYSGLNYDSLKNIIETELAKSG